MKVHYFVFFYHIVVYVKKLNDQSVSESGYI